MVFSGGRGGGAHLINPTEEHFSLNNLKKTAQSKPNSLKGRVHISAHVHESKCFFLFLINFMALKIPLTCTSVITFHNNLLWNIIIISPSKMTDDQNSQKMLVDCTHIVDIEFSVDL